MKILNELFLTNMELECDASHGNMYTLYLQPNISKPYCDHHLPPMTLKSQSIQSTITCSVSSKFDVNPSSAFWFITFIK